MYIIRFFRLNNMTKKEEIIRVLLVLEVFLVVLFMSVQSAEAFGTSPVNSEILVFPGETLTRYFRVYNSKAKKIRRPSPM